VESTTAVLRDAGYCFWTAIIKCSEGAALPILQHCTERNAPNAFAAMNVSNASHLIMKHGSAVHDPAAAKAIQSRPACPGLLSYFQEQPLNDEVSAACAVPTGSACFHALA
jgi:hypothetical protein